MMHRIPLIPDASHPISIEPEPKRIIVMANAVALVDTRNALRLTEASYPVVHYFPRTDVDMSQLQRSDHLTYCPYKGDCNYFSIPAGGVGMVNAVWTYENPYPPVEVIKGHLAFYAERVDLREMS